MNCLYLVNRFVSCSDFQNTVYRGSALIYFTDCYIALYVRQSRAPGMYILVHLAAPRETHKESHRERPPQKPEIDTTRNAKTFGCRGKFHVIRFKYKLKKNCSLEKDP